MTVQRQTITQVAIANVAYAQLTVQHPELANEVELAWTEYLISVGWTLEDWTKEVQQVMVQAQAREILEKQGLSPEQIARSMDEAS